MQHGDTGERWGSGTTKCWTDLKFDLTNVVRQIDHGLHGLDPSFIGTKIAERV